MPELTKHQFKLFAEWGRPTLNYTRIKNRLYYFSCSMSNLNAFHELKTIYLKNKDLLYLIWHPFPQHQLFFLCHNW